MQTVNLFWFRRDLRISDNHGLFQALTKAQTIPCFIFDTTILAKLAADDRRIDFIGQCLAEIKSQLKWLNSDLIVLSGDPQQLIPQLAKQFKVQAVYCNEDYESAAISRDQAISEKLRQLGINFYAFQDQLIFAKQQVVKPANNQPYTIYTAYQKRWLAYLEQNSADKLAEYPSQELSANFLTLPASKLITAGELGFQAYAPVLGGQTAAEIRLAKFLKHIDSYDLIRDFPALSQTSQLGVDLRFGTLSLRRLVRLAWQRSTSGAKTWLNELIWREFFSQILYNYPQVVSRPFQRKYTNLEYTNQHEWFKRWCEGTTGYPLVDAGMRELNQSGFMHNRVRMVCAAFLTKDLLIDWRWGEKYFAEKLLDYELASNNGNWQWCASTGCDAQPYFRIFNPMLQAKRYDPEAKYIKKFVPELQNYTSSEIHDLVKLANCRLAAAASQVKAYPSPIVEHSRQAAAAKQMFKNCG